MGINCDVVDDVDMANGWPLVDPRTEAYVLNAARPAKGNDLMDAILALISIY